MASRSLGTALQRLFALQPGEGPSITRLWLVSILFASGLQIADGVAQTLFLKRVGVEHLPFMFMAVAAVNVLVATSYVVLTARLNHLRLLWGTLALAGIGIFLLWVGALFRHPLVYPLLYGFHEAISTLFTIHWGVYLLDLLPRQVAARSFPLIYSGGRIGAMGGGILLGLGARWLDPAHLLLLGGAAFLLALSTSLTLKHATPPPDSRQVAQIPEDIFSADEGAPLIHLRRGFSLIARSPLLRAITLSTALMVFCRCALRYLYSATFADTFSEGDLASFYGLYLTLANGLSILVQIFITSRLLIRPGMLMMNLCYALMLMLGFGLLGLWSGLGLAVLARLIESELKATFKTPLSSLFYAALPSSQRAAARALVLGIVVPLATIFVSLLLRLRSDPHVIVIWGGVFSLFFVVATLLQNQRYRVALRESELEVL